MCINSEGGLLWLDCVGETSNLEIDKCWTLGRAESKQLLSISLRRALQANNNRPFRNVEITSNYKRKL